MSLHLDVSPDPESDKQPSLAGTVVSIAIVTAGMIAIGILAAWPGVWM